MPSVASTPASQASKQLREFSLNSGTGNYSQISLGQSLAGGTVLWIKAGTTADLSVLGAYSDPTPQPVQPGGAYFPGAGLEVWSPALPDAASSWDFDASTGQWSNHLAGDLASVSSPPSTLSPGQAFYLQSAAAASLETPDPALRIRYYHEDHLGSSSAITDADGALVEETAFYPFGHPRNEYEPRKIQDPYQFTQKERDKESGLHYFEKRYLTSVLSRFLTPDPKLVNPDLLQPQDFASYEGQPQKINSYAYAQNNPVVFCDPDGLDTWGAQVQAEVSMGADASVGVGVVSYGEDWYSHLNPLNLGVCGSFGQGVGTPGASLSVELSHNEGGRGDYEGRSRAYSWSGGEGVVVSGSYSTGSGRPTGAVAVGLGIGPTPVGGSYKKTTAQCVTGRDVVMTVGEGLWSVVPRSWRPWTAAEDRAHQAELRTGQLEQETRETWAQVHKIEASNDEKLRQIDEKLQMAQQLLEAKEREAQQEHQK
jgi:RHS repeat-associated protein